MKFTFRRCLVLSLATGFMGLYAALPDPAMAAQSDAHCVHVGPLKGTYVYSYTGYSADTSGDLLPFAVAGRATFSANGTLSGESTTTTKGQSVQSKVAYTGTYSANADGSVSETDTDAHGVVSHFDDFPSCDGNTIAFIATDPGVISSGIETRSSPE
jgi:hypothetical protein